MRDEVFLVPVFLMSKDFVVVSFTGHKSKSRIALLLIVTATLGITALIGTEKVP